MTTSRISGEFTYEMSGQRESNPLLKFHDVARFQHKAAAISALTALCKNVRFALFAQNYAVPVFEFVRKSFSPSMKDSTCRMRTSFSRPSPPKACLFTHSNLGA